jgi:predicted dehydrogenase
MTVKIKVGIIGCGNASAWIDTRVNKITNNPFSHLSVLAVSKQYEIIACCDINSKKANLFAKKFQIKNVYLSAIKMLNENSIDLLLICSPTKFHYEQSMLALNNKSIKIVICEKPFGFNYNKAKNLIQCFKKKKKLFLISYQRRWDKFYDKVRNYIKNEKLGKLKSVVGHVDKALFQNSSHMIDLIISFCGKTDQIYGFFDRSLPPRLVHDYKDFGGYIFCKHKNNSISFIKATTDNVMKKYFEVEINFTNGRIVLDNDNESLKIFTFKKSKFFKNYKQLYLQKKLINKFKGDNRLEIMYKFIFRFYNDRKTKLPFDIYDLIEPLKIINSLK